MEVDKETESQIQELQALEKNLQAILMQKHTFQMELTEIENALSELEKNTGEVYKITGNIMLKTSKESMIKDLKQKKDLINLRLKSIETQEKAMSDNSESLRKKILEVIGK